MSEVTYVRTTGLSLPKEFGPHNLMAIPGAAVDENTTAFKRFSISTRAEPDEAHVLGPGKYGPVLQVVLADGKVMAAKVFTPSGQASSNLLQQQVEHEMRRGSRDMGEHFVRTRAVWKFVDDRGEANFILLMDLAEGSTLAQLRDMAAESGHAIPAQVQEALTDQMIEVLHLLRTHGVVFQDIKPSNAFFTPAGRLVFIDHGSSQRRDDGTNLTLENTPQYLAPEVFDTSKETRVDGNAFTHESDTFAAGVTLLEVLTAGKPYHGSPLPGMRTRLGEPNLDHPHLDSKVRRVIAGMIAQDPELRLGPQELIGLLKDNPRSAPPSEDATRPALATVRTADPLDTTVAEDGFSTIGSVDLDPQAGDRLQGSKPPEALPEEAPTLSATRAPDATASQRPFTPPVLAPLIPLDPYARQEPAKRSPFINFAGVDSSLVYEGNQRLLYRIISFALIVYGLYVLAGMSAYLYQATDSLTFAALGGVTIGSLIAFALINYDRSLVGAVYVDTSESALRDESVEKGPPGRFWFGIAARVVIALTASYLFADALAIEVNRKSVVEEITATLEAPDGVYADLERDVPKLYEKEATALANKESAAQRALDSLKGAPASWERKAIREAQGLGSSGVKGCGEKCEELQFEGKKARRDLSQDLTQYEKNLADATTAIVTLDAKVQEAVTEAKAEAFRNATSPERLSSTLFDNATQNFQSGLRYFGLIILFMGIELAALLIKMIVYGGPYETEVKSRYRQAARRSAAEQTQARAELDAKVDENRDLILKLVSVDGAARSDYLDQTLRTSPDEPPRI